MRLISGNLDRCIDHTGLPRTETPSCSTPHSSPGHAATKKYREKKLVKHHMWQVKSIFFKNVIHCHSCINRKVKKAFYFGKGIYMCCNTGTCINKSMCYINLQCMCYTSINLCVILEWINLFETESRTKSMFIYVKSYQSALTFNTIMNVKRYQPSNSFIEFCWIFTFDFLLQ